MNWPVIIVVGIILIALIVFLVRRNVKDEKDFEHPVKNDYPKRTDEEGDVKTEETVK